MDLKTLINKIDTAPKALTELMKELKVDNKLAFKKVLRGFPERTISSYGGDIGVCYLKKINFESDLDEKSLPESLDITLGIICKGTKTQSHDKTIKLNLNILEKFLENEEWVTLNGNVESTSIVNHEIFIEQTKNTLLTTSVFELKCDLEYYELEKNEGNKDISYNEGVMSFDD